MEFIQFFKDFFNYTYTKDFFVYYWLTNFFLILIFYFIFVLVDFIKDYSEFKNWKIKQSEKDDK